MSEISIQDLTTGDLNGDGVFDQLMIATTKRLDDAFSKNRITATDYSTLLNSGIATAMQQAISFLLSVQQSDAQAELTKAQKLVVDQDLLNAQVQNTLLTKQVLQADQELIHLVAQTAIVAEGLNTAIADTAVKVQQKLNLVTEELKSDSDIALNSQRVLNLQKDALKSTAETSLIDQNTTNAVSTNITITKQQSKIDAEVALLTQKEVTETAQTQNNAHVDSVIGKQISLYQKQADGFDRDAEQKMSKMLLDTWAIRQSTDGALASPAGINDDSIKDVIDAAKLGINVQPPFLIYNAAAIETSPGNITITFETEESTGTIFYLVNNNPEETAGSIASAGSNISSGVTGVVAILESGLAPGAHYVHIFQTNGAGELSNTLNSAPFTTT